MKLTIMLTLLLVSGSQAYAFNPAAAGESKHDKNSKPVVRISGPHQ